MSSNWGYDAGLKKSRFGEDQESSQGEPVQVRQQPPGQQQQPSENSKEEYYSTIFMNELRKAINTIESLYDAILPLDRNLADDLLEQSLLELNKAVRRIAANFSLNVHTALSRDPEILTEPTKTTGPKPTRKKRKLQETSIPIEEEKAPPPINPERRTGPIKIEGLN